MDYEKMYKAVLKTATQWIKDGCSDKEKICLESVFPELRESEDERIRKFLVDYFTSYKIGNVATKLNGVRIDDILAYLEKQKDLDKMIVVSPEVWDNAISDAYENGEKEGEKQKEQKHPNGCFTCDEYKKGYEEGRRNGFTAGYNKAMKEVEQKEQKPNIEICPHSIKSKSYKENGYPIEDCDYGLEIAKDILEKTLGKVEGYQSDDGIRENQTAIQAVKDAMKEQKPSCWNSPVMTNEMIMDEQKPDSLIYDKDLDKAAREFYLSGGADSPVDSTGLVPIVRMAEFGATWMKKKMEEEQKPAEWSEEDEEMLNSCISSIEESKENRYAYKETDGDTSYDREVDWLKSLKPKPKQEWSEEDEEKITFLERLIRYNVPEGQYGWTDGHRGGFITKLEAIAILKSLRPSWKPSEAQLMALHSVIDDESDTIGNEQLKLLYNDLKKL